MMILSWTTSSKFGGTSENQQQGFFDLNDHFSDYSPSNAEPCSRAERWAGDIWTSSATAWTLSHPFAQQMIDNHGETAQGAPIRHVSQFR